MEVGFEKIQGPVVRLECCYDQKYFSGQRKGDNRGRGQDQRGDGVRGPGGGDQQEGGGGGAAQGGDGGARESIRGGRMEGGR